MNHKVVIIRRPQLLEAAHKAIEELKRVLEDAPSITDVEVDTETRTGWQSTWDYRIKLRVNGELRTLLAEYSSSGQPRIARTAAAHLARLIEKNPEAYPLFIAPYISERTAEFCATENIGYVDSAGNCRIAMDGLYIRVEGRSNPYTVKRDLRSLYSPKAERILRVLLEVPGKSWRLQEVADDAQVSLGLAASVKSLLEDREWIKSGLSGFQLVAHTELLDEWSRNYKFERHRETNLFSLKKPSEIEASLAECCSKSGIRYALTGLSAAARYSPYATYQRVVCYVEADAQVEMIAESNRLKPVDSGPNVVLLVPYDEGVFHGSREVDRVRIVNPIQCYLDSLHTTSRGREAAEYLREQVIDKR